MILKTSGGTIDKVVQHAKHALHRPLYLARGELILISQTEASLRHGDLPIRYSMEFVRCYEDKDGESLQIWGKRWNYIVQGANCRQLKKPFRMGEVQVSGKTYGQGFVRFNVEPEDEHHLQISGHLDTLRDGVT